MPRRLTITLLACCAGLAVGCGDNNDPPSEAAPDPPSAAEIIRERNETAIADASQDPEALAVKGAPAIRRTLKRKLGMNNDQEFAFAGNVHEVIDCYVKTGADAVSFAHMDENMLYSPKNPADLIFVQGTPLVRCLKVVKDALGW